MRERIIATVTAKTKLEAISALELLIESIQDREFDDLISERVTCIDPEDNCSKDGNGGKHEN